MPRRTKAQEAARQETVKDLKAMIRRASKDHLRQPVVYLTLRHVSKSGMLRIIDAHIVVRGEIQWIGSRVATVIDWGYDYDRNGIRVNGAGMDMGFHLVYSLSAALYGYKDEGGYRLTHRWI